MTAPRASRGPQPWTGSRERSRQIGRAEAMGEIACLISFDLKGMDPARALAAVQQYADGAHLLGVMPVMTMADLDGPLGWGSPDQSRQQPGGAR